MLGWTSLMYEKYLSGLTYLQQIYVYIYNIYLSKNIFSQCQKNDTSIYFTYASKATFKFLRKLLNAMYCLS